MRLRPSQFVFLLLLACSVRVGGGCVLRLTAAAVSESAKAALQTSGISVASIRREPAADRTLRPSAHTTDLDAASSALHRTIWAMRPPNAESTAVISFTGLLRA